MDQNAFRIQKGNLLKEADLDIAFREDRPNMLFLEAYLEPIGATCIYSLV